MKEDTIKIELSFTKDEEGGNYLSSEVIINGKAIKQFAEFTDFLLSSKDNRSYHDKKYYPKNKQLVDSSFYPFTCSCGIAGCAGIWEGIKSNHRKHTVEWRVPTKAGYSRFLDKNFYSFSKEQYEGECDKCWAFLEDNLEVEVLQDYEDENETIGEKFNWLWEK